MKPSWLVVLLAAGVTGCGGGGGGGAGPLDPPPPPPPAFSCTGAAPAHSTLCPGTDKGLADDTPRVLLGPTESCGSIRCAYSCDAGYLAVDGACQASGPPDPPARFSANGDGTVTDGRTGLVWLQDADCPETLAGISRADGVSFYDAGAWVAALGAGACGLQDGSIPGEWVLPDAAKALDLAADLGAAATAGLFSYRAGSAYWTSYQDCITNAFAVTVPGPPSPGSDPATGALDQFDVGTRLGAWPYRGGSP